MRRWLLAGVLALIAVSTAGATGPPARGTFTYEQAVAAGIQVLPGSTGLNSPPVCKPDPSWKGFATAAAAEKAIAAAPDAPTCVADPRAALYSIGYATPRPARAGADTGYRWAGAQTTGRFQGSRATIEVGNPGVTHGGVDEHVVARVMAKNPAGTRWVEGGWAEVGWLGDARYAYSFSEPGGGWHFHPEYPLTTGSYYAWRVRDNGNNSAVAEIFWNGSWQTLESNGTMLCQYSYGTSNCPEEEYTEVHSLDGSWPALNAPVDGSGVSFAGTQVRTAPSAWASWSDSLYPSTEGGDAPYAVCWTSRDWSFRTPQGAC